MSKDTVRRLLDRHGTTYSQDAGITLADKPSPLFRLLVLSLLLSARINSAIAVAAARELCKAGFRTPRRMADATSQQRVDALGRGHYRRYDERTSTMLGESLQQFKGIGPTGATIFCREVQGIWPELAPYVDDIAARGAKRLGLPTDAGKLAKLVSDKDFPRLVAACVKAARSKDVVDDVLAQ